MFILYCSWLVVVELNTLINIRLTEGGKKFTPKRGNKKKNKTTIPKIWGRNKQQQNTHAKERKKERKKIVGYKKTYC